MTGRVETGGRARWHRGGSPWVGVSIAVSILALAGCPDRGGAPPSKRVQIELSLEGGALVAASDVIRVFHGQHVELRWTTDETATIHLHGYDIEMTLEPGIAQKMRFVAHATGRFPIMVHGSGGAAAAAAHDHAGHDHGEPDPQDLGSEAETALAVLEVRSN